MRENIFKTARRLTEDFGTKNPKELCALLGISFLFADLPDSISGFYMEKNGRQALVVNHSLSAEELTFCSAHELGHAVLHKGINAVFITENTNFSLGKFEREADLFAAALLIDSELIDECDGCVEKICLCTGLPIYAVQGYVGYLCKDKDRQR